MRTKKEEKESWLSGWLQFIPSISMAVLFFKVLNSNGMEILTAYPSISPYATAAFYMGTSVLMYGTLISTIFKTKQHTQISQKKLEAHVTKERLEQYEEKFGKFERVPVIAATGTVCSTAGILLAIAKETQSLTVTTNDSTSTVLYALADAACLIGGFGSDYLLSQRNHELSEERHRLAEEQHQPSIEMDDFSRKSMEAVRGVEQAEAVKKDDVIIDMPTEEQHRSLSQ